ncbi:MAG: DUF4058 family protein [Verrucomicrobia bacterium]|nr:DUF4058 family protein [Verrucomicrobiota bacterium]
MKSPFPGMDPYLETRWEGVHHALIVYACDALQPHLPDDIRARIEVRVFVETEQERIRHIVPDVHVTRVYPPPAEQPYVLREGGAAVAEELVFELHELEITEGYIEIRERGGGKVITVIEFLSPANKSGGTGQAKYLEKQAEVLQSDASLVEIDLVRAGERVLALPTHLIPPQHRGHYLACISPGWKRNRRELHAMPLRQRLPVLHIPLRQNEAPVDLDLQALVDHTYAAGRYDDLDYVAELEPPLSSEDAAWAAELLGAASKH